MYPLPPKYKSPLTPTPPVTTKTPVLVDVAGVLTGLIVNAIDEFVIVVCVAATTNFIEVPLVNVPKTKSPAPAVAFLPTNTYPSLGLNTVPKLLACVPSQPLLVMPMSIKALLDVTLSADATISVLALAPALMF